MYKVKEKKKIAVGKIYAQVLDKDGKLLFEYEGENLITSVGKAAMAGLVSAIGSVPAFTYLGTGSSSTPAAIGDTTLGSENSTNGMGRQAGTMSLSTTVVTNDTLNALYTWTATGAVTINECGIFNAASVGTLLGHFIFPSTITLANTNQFKLTYSVQFV